MTLREWITVGIEEIRTSPITHGAITAGMIMLALAGVLAILLGVTFLLRRYFTRHPVVNKAHRIFAYLLTMLGVVILLLGAALGAVLPVIPGVLFLLLALLLLRTQYKSRWMTAKIRYLQFKLRIKKAIRRKLHKPILAKSTRRDTETLRTLQKRKTDK